jgi:hypothetical protein
MTPADTPAKVWTVYLSGLMAASIAAAWMRPYGAGHSFAKAVMVAAVWVVATIQAGACGVCIAESLLARRPALPEKRLVAGAAATWILIPPILLCWLRGSGWAAPMSAAAGAAMAFCLWGMASWPSAQPFDVSDAPDEGPRFAALPAPDSGRSQALVIAVCVELAIVLANRDAVFLATALTAIAGYMLVWKRLASLNTKTRDDSAGPAARASLAFVLSLLILVPLLLARFVRMEGSAETTAQAAARSEAKAEKGDAANPSQDAYRGIILFTVQEKKKELPPLPIQRDLLRTGIAKPLVIPFDGSYWYFQASRQGPGLHPHLAHGDPVAANIYSTGWVPLAMQAHQTLAEAVDLRSCGSMQVTVRNGDNRRGQVEMGMLLTDSTLPGKPSMYLGIQPLVSTQPNHFVLKINPVNEEVKFAIPGRRTIRKFDDITVFFFPVEQRATLGARVGIQQFELIPR